MDNDASTITLDDLVRRAERVLRVPLAAALDIELIDAADPTAGVRFTVSGLAGNGAGGLHSAALTAGLEVSAYLVLLPRLARYEHAVTNTMALQLIGTVPDGGKVEARGSLDRRTGRLGFVSVVAVHRHNVVARGQITKSVVDLR